MNPKQRKSLALDDVWKSEEEIKKISQFSPHYSREIRDYHSKQSEVHYKCSASPSDFNSSRCLEIGGSPLI